MEIWHNDFFLQERKRQETSQQLHTNQVTGTYHKFKTDGPPRNQYLFANTEWLQKHRSTEDQLLAQEIENAFQEKKNNVAVFYDLYKAFDKVWREGLLLKVLQAGVSGRMYKWIPSFLHERSTRVKVDGHLSDSVKMREGVP